MTKHTGSDRRVGAGRPTVLTEDEEKKNLNLPDLARTRFWPNERHGEQGDN